MAEAGRTKRLMADIRELQNPLYKDTGIFYEANEENTSKGYACVFGPSGTPYEDCPMLYEFTIGSSFPFDPPKVEFRTYDGITRFHPNMYKEGKCCLSILHTWEGPKWASTMRLSTVLVTLQSLLDTNPIRHEPGLRVTPSTEKGYSEFVEHSCIEYTLERYESIEKGRKQPAAFEPFLEIFKERRLATLERLKKRLEEKLASGERTWAGLPYSLHRQTNYSGLLQRVNHLLSNKN